MKGIKSISEDVLSKLIAFKGFIAPVYWLRVLVVLFYYAGGAIGLFYLATAMCKPKTYLFGEFINKI